MAVIAKCNNQSCPSKDSCYRYTVEANPLWKSYGNFEPEWEGKQHCDYYWKDNRLDSLKKG